MEDDGLASLATAPAPNSPSECRDRHAPAHPVLTLPNLEPNRPPPPGPAPPNWELSEALRARPRPIPPVIRDAHPPSTLPQRGVSDGTRVCL